MARGRARVERWTWDHRRQGAGVRPAFVERLSCGCWWDRLMARMWEPCMAHEGEGHVCVISEQDGAHVVRCLVRECGFRETNYVPGVAIGTAQDHWMRTRNSRSEASSAEG